MLPVLNHFKEQYKLDKLVVVADSGLISQSNKELNESSAIKQNILSSSLADGELKLINKTKR